jgi:hypothetical protein
MVIHTVSDYTKVAGILLANDFGTQGQPNPTVHPPVPRSTSKSAEQEPVSRYFKGEKGEKR